MPSDVTYSDLLNAAAQYLGWQREATPTSPTIWSSQEASQLAEIVKRGYRQFLYPPVIQGEKLGHTWSFLHPTITFYVWPSLAGTLQTAVYDGTTYTTLTATAATFYETAENKYVTFTTSGNQYLIHAYTSSTAVVLVGDASAETGAFTIAHNYSFTMPDDFAAFIGDITYADGNIRRIIKHVSEGHIRRQFELAGAVVTGTPIMMGTRPYQGDGTAAQRFEALCYPNPGGTYGFQAKVALNPKDLSATYPYPMGGPMHSETLIASVEAIAELVVNDEIGSRTANFVARLATSIAHDRRLGSVPNSLGYNRNWANRAGVHKNVSPFMTIVSYS